MREQVRVRYLGDDVVEVRGAGVFQRDTIASVPRDLALDLLGSDAWALVSEGPPAIEVRFRVGPWEGPDPALPPAATRALEPADPADFGDLPSEGPESDDPEADDPADAP